MILFTKSHVTGDAFIEFVHERGGIVTDLDVIDGSFSIGECHVWFYGARLQLEGHEKKDDEQSKNRLGTAPEASLSFHLSHHSGSAAIAFDVALNFLRCWGGVVSFAACVEISKYAVREEWALAAVPLGPDIKLFGAEMSCFGSVLSAFDGCRIERTDHLAQNEASRELSKLFGDHFQPDAELVVGLIPAAEDYLWVTVQLEMVDACRIIFGYGATTTVQRTALALAREMLSRENGYLCGVFELCLSLFELTKLLATNSVNFA